MRQFNQKNFFELKKKINQQSCLTHHKMLVSYVNLKKMLKMVFVKPLVYNNCKHVSLDYSFSGYKVG